MLFNSLDFAFFLPIVFFLYWFVVQKNLKFQNALIVIASYFFYGWWDWRFLSLIIFSTIVDYTIGQQLRKEHQQSKRKILLWTSVIVNIGFLGFFKYYNFFQSSFIDAFSLFGVSINSNSLNIILPVGISFYTFQTLSYTIDVFKKKIKPTKDFIAFSAFVCFFPQLVAGPIERATHLLPQFYKKRSFQYHKAVDGMRQILWGLFKKAIIADNCAEFANLIFNNSADYSGSTLVIGTFVFAIQIYCDFSGYTDIAIGTSRLFGFDIKQNFATPYFSRSILEFWKRWHISLTKWLTDYVFTPLAIDLRHYENKGIITAIFITFGLSGLWHGANWTFIFWGVLHSFYYLITILLVGHKAPKGTVANDKMLPSIKEFLGMLLTFILVSFSYIFFRAENLTHAFNFIGVIFSKSLFTIPYYVGLKIPMLLSFFLFTVEWVYRKQKFALEGLSSYNVFYRWLIYIIIIFMIIYFYPQNNSPFIYFQF